MAQLGFESQSWLAIAQGNSRTHWAQFESGAIAARGHSRHLQASETPVSLAKLPWWSGLSPEVPRVVASVVPEQWQRLQAYLPPKTPIYNLGTVSLPLGGVYRGFGLDRGLAALGAGQRWGVPLLLIDGGTALTLTGIDGEKSLVGGAILPGLGLQSRALVQGTALSDEIDMTGGELPPRWALETGEAIRSGILYTLLAGVEQFIEQWQQRFPESAIVLTGGDGATLAAGLQAIAPQIAPKVVLDEEALFWGMAAMVSQLEVTRGDRS
ncbi:MAG: type III pantothenate kinase [Sodalinema sp.]|uniref:type III pantothenate kinase n=1 Tax=Sodalinema sp. TaxID=3080550 RepID=UPI0012001381|nr:MAG: type III pantothenate kinase [Phormidium sp. SL48-SHIP]